MQKCIACLLLVALTGIMPILLSAQQNQSAEKSEQKIEALEKRVSELEKQLQAVENVEKLELQAKLAEANAKLANAEFGKFERELRDSNDEWLGTWSERFLGIAAILVAIFLGISGIFWFWLRYRADRLIADEVEKSLNGFKEAVDQVEVMKDELGALKREHAASVLKSFRHLNFEEGHSYPERLEALSEEVLLQVFEDEIYGRRVRSKAMEILAHRKSSRFVSQSLEFINSTVDREDDQLETYALHPHIYIRNLGKAHTQETHQGVSKFLNRLLTENPAHTDSVLTLTTLALSDISVELNVGDSVSLLKRSIPHLKIEQTGRIVIDSLVRCFDNFHEPDGIKEILTNHLPGEMHKWESVQGSVENKCLELLQKYDPDFVEEWRARETSDNSEA